ncbi:MAG TPA: hypothetical protein VM843_08585 [Flavisolibacter sp.]|jgi:hypothetical protein|nr:hypothetical protein [Flavisolibacter sp.]
MKHVIDLLAAVLALLFRLITAPLLLMLLAVLLIAAASRWLHAVYMLLPSLHIHLPKSPLAFNWKKRLAFHRSRTA